MSSTALHAHAPAVGTRDLDLLVIGDANPDLILSGGDLEPAFGQRERLVDQAALVLGGSGSITACGAARLGLRTAMAACVGDDVLGRFMLERLGAAGVDTTAVQVLEGVPTGVSVALARPDDRAVLTARGALAAMDPAAVPDAALRRARHVHIAAPFLQPRLLEGLAPLVARAHAAGASVSLDTNWDPEERWSQLTGALGAVDLLLPNEQEVVRLAAAAAGPSATGGAGAAGQHEPLPPDAGPQTAALALAARGPLVVVKLGPDGALAVRGDDVVRVTAPRVETVDAIGAGDSFDAGFLAGWLDADDLRRALALGCACGALSTRAAGGTASQATLVEAQELAGAPL